MGWSSQEEYEAEYGTQAVQAAKENANKIAVDGPWRLVRTIKTSDGPKVSPLDNSVRSTSKEILALKDREFERTGIIWQVQKYS